MPRLPQSYPSSVNNPNYEKITPVDRHFGCGWRSLRLLQPGSVQQHAWRQLELDGRIVDLEQRQQERRRGLGECIGEQRDFEVEEIFVVEEEEQRESFAFSVRIAFGFAVVAAGSLLRLAAA